MGEPPPETRHTSLLGKLWENAVAAPLREVEADAQSFRESPAGQGADYKILTVFVTTSVMLTLQQYGSAGAAVDWTVRAFNSIGLTGVGDAITSAMGHREHAQLFGLMPSYVMQFLGWFLVPCLIIRLVFRERISDYGIKLQGFLAGWWLYLVMLAVVLPLVYLVSFRESFLLTYPYYRLNADEPFWPHLWCWEALYLTSFFFLEFFFRGFMIHGAKHRLGAYAILPMTVPYCMIHFGKPLPETLGSIIAGLALGFMSLKTRSIWMGTALHVTVAVTMDVLALSHAGRLRW
jgi:membrane protease YdiL (CAAX protease family)